VDKGEVRLSHRLGGAMLYPMTMRRAKWVVCVSHATRDELCGIFPKIFHKTIVLASGVDDSLSANVDGPTALMIREHLHIPNSYVFYSGSTGANKNLPNMTQAFALLVKSEPALADLKLVLDLSGDLSGLRDVQETIRRYSLADVVRIYTSLADDERQVLYRGARALFMATKGEGFGFQALRAQLAHVPVVAADSGALPEICGEGALLSDPDNVENMREMLRQALIDESLREYLIDKGVENARRFSWESTASRVRQVYELLF
jgi:glycosyltransferase involved in cell wall biosynthesis